MKKYVVLLLLFISASCAYAIDLVPKVSLCLPGTFRSDYEVDIAANVGVEGRYAFSNHFSATFGVDWLINRNVSMGLKASRDPEFDKGNYNNTKFTMVPVYVGLMWFPFGNLGEYRPYLRLEGGYNVYCALSNGSGATPGYYVAGGFGFELYDRFIFELETSRQECEYDDDNITYKDIMFRFGYKFII